MEITGNTILITGGATGIGFALAEEFVKLGNKVIICGRRGEKLEEAKNKMPEIETRVCDVSNGVEREELLSWICGSFSDINVLINNAGIQRAVDFKTGKSDRVEGEDEVDINLKSTIHLCELFAPYFLKKESAIVNVSSGLGFVPIASMPVYCATKAAVHSFSLSLRHQLKDTSIRVFEIIPPIVDTELDKGRRKGFRGISPNEVAKEVLDGMKSDKLEMAVGMAGNLVDGDFEENFKRMNS